MRKLVMILGLVCVSILTFAQQGLIQKEIIVSKNSQVKISSNNRNINVVSWNEDKVKVVVAGYTKLNAASIDEKLEKLGITIHQLGMMLNISIKEGDYSNVSINENGINIESEEGTVIIDSVNGVKIEKSGLKKSITIYVPKNSKLGVNSKYGNVNFKNEFRQLNLDVTNGNVDLEKASSLMLTSKYANFTGGDIGEAEIDFINGNFTVNNIDNGTLDTKYSNVEITTAKVINFSSTNDEYEMDEVGEVKGTKNYGNFRIGKLTGSIEMAGTNADIKVRNVAASVTNIKFDDKYADIRMPLKALKNYSVKFAGAYSTVYANFDIINKEGGDDNFKFSANVGSGANTKIDIKCINCTVDMK